MHTGSKMVLDNYDPANPPSAQDLGIYRILEKIGVPVLARDLCIPDYCTCPGKELVTQFDGNGVLNCIGTCLCLFSVFSLFSLFSVCLQLTVLSLSLPPSLSLSAFN